MRIPRARVTEILATTPGYKRAPRRHDINRLTAKLRADLYKQIAKHMQPCMLLLDEVVQFFIHFERYQYSRKLTAESSLFAQQISRLRSDVISIRELITLGQEVPALVLARAFVEDIELAMAFAIDPDFAVSYSAADDQTAFWKSQIAYGKIYSRVEAFIQQACLPAEEVESHIAYHKAVKSSLSGHVHSARHSIIRSAAVPSLVRPGMFHLGQLGALSAHLPSLCLFLADEAYMFSACCIKLFIKPNPPHAFMNYKLTGVLDDVIASAHLLQELHCQYMEDLRSYYDALLFQESKNI